MPQSNRTLVTCGLLAFTVAAGALVHAGQQGQAPKGFPLSNTVRERGVGVTGALEGWYYDKDGSVNILVGYFNRNTKQELDIPVGPNNRVEPGGPDRGQPTHFLPSRQYGVFAIRLPKDFGDKKLTWTLVANGQTNVITLHTKPDWVVEPFEDSGSKNTPPVLRFEPGGPTHIGPPRGVSASYTATVATPLTLTVWATDTGPTVNVNPNPPAGRRGATGGFTPPPPLVVSWSVFRGPGTVTFGAIKPPIDKTDGRATTSAIFGVPGDYILRVQANDQSGDGGGGFQCCWTNAHVAVAVKPAVTTTGGDR
jgi:hypothetical protein